jgi:CubicO group peptidase (beta-lactamase class C family)
MLSEVFKPLGMDNSFVYRKTESNGNDQEVNGYISRRRKAEDSYLNGVVGDKGIYSTVEDLYKFDVALQEGSLVDLTELGTAYELAHKDLYDHDNYGYGWRIIKKKEGEKIVYHSGWWKGFRSYFIRDLKEKKSIIVLTNNSRIGMFGITELCDLFDIETR